MADEWLHRIQMLQLGHILVGHDKRAEKMATRFLFKKHKVRKQPAIPNYFFFTVRFKFKNLVKLNFWPLHVNVSYVPMSVPLRAGQNAVPYRGTALDCTMCYLLLN